MDDISEKLKQIRAEYRAKTEPFLREYETSVKPLQAKYDASVKPFWDEFKVKWRDASAKQ